MILDNARQAGRWLLRLSAWALVSLPAQAAFDIRTDTDYIAVVFEAEDNVTKDERWVLTEPDTPAQENDPDPNHSDLAVGQAYLELLPDVRVTHEDSFGPPTAAWFTPGTGPRAEYLLDFPEAGRYYVHVRALSTGTEDNGLHIGLDGDFPDSGKNLQFCTANKGWSWSGRQRDSGATGSCGVQKTIWVTVEEAGEHTFMISAREDGFEIDRVMLIKDLSDNTRICKPNNEDDINCVNGSVENVDEIVDMEVLLEQYDSAAGEAEVAEGDSGDDDAVSGDATEIDIDQSVDVRAVVRNLDSFDVADEVFLTVGVEPGDDWDVQDMPEECVQQEAAIVCDLGDLEPSGRDGELLLGFSLKPLRSGELPVVAEIVTSSVDDDMENDNASMVFTVSDEGSLSNLSVQIMEPLDAWQVDQSSMLNLTLVNNGPAAALDVSLALSMPAALAITGVPETCILVGTLRCDFEEIDIDESKSFAVEVTASDAGLYSVNLIANALNLDMNSEDESSDTIIVTVEAVEEEQPVEPEPEDTTDENPVEPDPDDTTDEGTDDESEGDNDSDASSTAKSSSGGAAGAWILSLMMMSLLTKLAMVRNRP